MVRPAVPRPEPHSYGTRTTEAVKRVLVELGQVLGDYRGRFVVIGGNVPWLQIPNAETAHIGSIDIDLALDAEALADGQYKGLVETLLAADYRQPADGEVFQLTREVPGENGGPAIKIVIDFLMPKTARIKKNRPPLIPDFAVIPASGADMALRFNDLIAVEAEMPEGGRNEVELSVATIPAFLVMKGFALVGRKNDKDAYDVWYAIRNYPGGLEALAQDCLPLLKIDTALEGFAGIADKFRARDYIGPVSVRRFAAQQGILDSRDEEAWQTDAFGQIDAFLKAISIR
jgi:hypothetical protein